jgi:hypothetical protein
MILVEAFEATSSIGELVCADHWNGTKGVASPTTWRGIPYQELFECLTVHEREAGRGIPVRVCATMLHEFFVEQHARLARKEVPLSEIVSELKESVTLATRAIH